jgi:hypothetical protein
MQLVNHSIFTLCGVLVNQHGFQQTMVNAFPSPFIRMVRTTSPVLPASCSGYRYRGLYGWGLYCVEGICYGSEVPCVLTGTQYEHDGGVDDEDVRV